MTLRLSIVSVVAMAAIACLGLPRATQAQVMPPGEGVGALVQDERNDDAVSTAA